MSWKSLHEIADGRDTTLTELVSTIDAGRREGNLSSAIRLFVLGFYRDQIRDQRSDPRGNAPGKLGLGPFEPSIGHRWGRQSIARNAPSGNPAVPAPLSADIVIGTDVQCHTVCPGIAGT